MWLWIFMLILVLLIPLSVIGFGHYFSRSAPKEINMAFGYRTRMSMKNKETWEFAHHHCGKIWTIVGWILLLVSCITMLFALGKDGNIISTYSAVLCCVQLIPLISSIIATEAALKKTFDKNGNRIA